MSAGSRAARTLVLIRHAESAWNAEGRLQGQADPPLSEAGRRQAQAAAAMVAGLQLDHVFCSDLRRARETADIVGLGHATPDPVWREHDVGSWTGRLEEEVRLQDPELHRRFRAGLDHPPGGERWDAFGDRLLAAVDRLPGSGTTAVVTHGGAVRILCARLFGIPAPQLVALDNASLTVVDLHADGPRLRRYNQVATD